MAQLCADSLRAGGKNLTNCDNEKDLMNPTSNLFQDVSVHTHTLYQLVSYLLYAGLFNSHCTRL